MAHVLVTHRKGGGNMTGRQGGAGAPGAEDAGRRAEPPVQGPPGETLWVGTVVGPLPLSGVHSRGHQSHMDGVTEDAERAGTRQEHVTVPIPTLRSQLPSVQTDLSSSSPVRKQCTSEEERASWGHRAGQGGVATRTPAGRTRRDPSALQEEPSMAHRAPDGCGVRSVCNPTEARGQGLARTLHITTGTHPTLPPAGILGHLHTRSPPTPNSDLPEMKGLLPVPLPPSCVCPLSLTHPGMKSESMVARKSGHRCVAAGTPSNA